MTAEAGATYSITGEVDMGYVTETSIVKCVLNRSCLEQNETRLAFLVRILRLLHLMLREIGLVIEEGKRPHVLRRLVL